MEDSLQRIRTDILEQLHCELKDQATNLVFGKGNPNANILFIGEAPGANEDLQGEPFVGRAGQQLDELLHHIKLGIEDVYIANILKYRPPKNRNPTAAEMENHTPYLTRQINAINPKVIVTLGNFATRFILNNQVVRGMNKIPGISKIHGEPQKISIQDTQRIVLPLYHPAAMLYNPRLKETIIEDLERLREILTA